MMKRLKRTTQKNGEPKLPAHTTNQVKRISNAWRVTEHG